MERKVTFRRFHCFKMSHLLGFVLMFYVPEYYDEGELPPDPVFPDSDNMDNFMQQMCDAIQDGSLGIDTNLNTEQANSVKPTTLCPGISNSDDTLIE